MKKYLLASFLLLTSSYAHAQLKQTGKKKIPVSGNIVSTITDIAIGQGPNAFGVAAGAKTFLWADPNLNAITFSHSSNHKITGDGSTGWLRLDYSKDGGQTWLTDQGPAYQSNNNNSPPFANARNPQGLLFNPPGNTNADSSYFTYFAPTLVNVNGAYGGYAHGSMQTSGSLVSTRTEEVSSRYAIPRDFTLTKAGTVYAIDMAEDNSSLTKPGYKDTLYIFKGVWNSGARDFDYTQSKLYAPVSRNYSGKANSTGVARITFADDGVTGYISMIGHGDFKTESDSVSQLIVYKTTDGGLSWGAAKIISMDGAKLLLPAVGNASQFTAGFEEDAVVDNKGNLHVVMPAGSKTDKAFTMSAVPGMFGIFDIYTTDGGTNWKAKLLGTPLTLKGTFGVSQSDFANPSTVEFNRCQASRNWNGDKLFFTWFDTDTLTFPPVDESHANMQPNSFTVGYDLLTNKWTSTSAPVTTKGTAASGTITFGDVSYYVFENNGIYALPLVYQELIGDATKTGSPTQFHYVNGLKISDPDFTDSDNSVPLAQLANLKDCKLSATVNSVSADCNTANGSATVTSVSGGASPFTYSWSNASTNAGINNIAAGVYFVQVIDANTCSANASITVGNTNGSSIQINFDSVSCFGTCTAFASAAATGGNSPYTYSWSTGSSSSSINNLCSGNYIVSLVDNIGCLSKAQIFIPQPSQLSFSVIGFSSCGQNNNSASVGALSGGTGNYTYSWSNGATTSSASHLPSGTYTITITDANGCTASGATGVSGLGVVTVQIVSSVSLICNNSCTGSANVSAAGGTTPYTYLWSNGKPTAAVNKLCAGNYTITVSDASSCTVTTSIKVRNDSVVQPAICMVTVDSLSRHNIIVWDKGSNTDIDSFIVYRETTFNTYKRIGALPFNVVSQFTDTVETKYFPFSGNPNAGTYRYKLQTRNVCGNYSTLSPYHNTIYVSKNNGTFNWNQYTIEGETTPVPTLTSYLLFRDDDNNGNWKVVNGVSSSQTTMTDPNYASYPNGNWRVETSWGIACSPTFKATQNFSASRSNASQPIVSSIKNDYANNGTLKIYPNPFSDKTALILELEINSGVEIVLYNSLGQAISTIEKKFLTAGRYVYVITVPEKGIYSLRAMVNGIAASRKLIGIE